VPVPKPDVIYPTPGHAFVAEDRALDGSPGPQWLSDTRIARLQWIKGRTARDTHLCWAPGASRFGSMSHTIIGWGARRSSTGLLRISRRILYRLGLWPSQRTGAGQAPRQA